MNKFFIITIFFTSFCYADDVPHPEEKYSLAVCQAKGLEKSQRLSIAELEVSIAEEKIHEIEGINTFKICAEGMYSIRDKHPGSVRKVPQQKVPKVPPSAVQQKGEQPQKTPSKIKTIVGHKENATSKLSLIVPICDFGYVDRLIAAQRSQAAATESERKRLEQNVLLAVTASYYYALQSTKIEEVVLQSIKLLSQQLSLAQDLYSVGIVTKNDVLGVKVQLAQRKQEYIQARHAIENSLDTLNRLTELNVKKTSELEDCATDVLWAGTLDQFLQKVNDTHPELATIHAHIRAAESAHGAIAAENYPEITGFASFNTNSDSYLLHRQWLHTGVGIQIPIFDGGIVASKLLQNRDRQKELSLQYEGKYQDICLQVKKAFHAVDAAYSKIPVAKESILHAEENVKIDADLYEEGLLASDDLLNDEERLAEARSNYFQALYNFKIAQAELAYAVGEIEI